MWRGASPKEVAMLHHCHVSTVAQNGKTSPSLVAVKRGACYPNATNQLLDIFSTVIYEL